VLFLVLALALIGISTSGPLARLSDAPPLAIATWRLGFSLLIVAVPLIWTRGWRQWRGLSGKDLSIAVAAGAFLAVHFWSWIASLGMTTVAASVLLVNLHPVAIIAGSALWLGERPTKRQIIGTIIAMLNRGPKAIQSEGLAEAEDMRLLGQNSTSHTEQILYGGGPALVNSSGVPWTAAYVDSIGEPTADLRSNIAAEARAKLVYERLITVTDDPGIKDALRFLMTREIAHQKSFEKALHSIQPNFPPGKQPGDPAFTDLYMDMSQGDGADDLLGSWNSGELWERVSDREAQTAVDGGDGSATVGLDPREQAAVQAMTLRTLSDPEARPTTGAELGAGPGAGALDLPPREP